MVDHLTDAPVLIRRRTICTVLNELRDSAEAREDYKAVMLCDEALGYARRMSLKLSEYKGR